MGLDVFLNSALVVAAKQAHGGFFDQFRKCDAVNDVERVERVALRLGHLVALGVAHDGIDVHMPERHFAGEMHGHHDHPSDPEENDVEAGDEHGRGEETSQIGCFLRPAERGKRNERRGKPRV